MEFAHSPICVGSLLVLRFPPTSPKVCRLGEWACLDCTSGGACGCGCEWPCDGQKGVPPRVGPSSSPELLGEALASPDPDGSKGVATSRSCFCSSF